MKMKTWITRMSAITLLVALPMTMSSCASMGGSKGATNAMGAAGSLFNSMGGASGVASLANAFGANLAGNPAVTKFLNSDAIKGVQNGLYNTIASAAGIKLPSGATDLLGSLSGKGLDEAALSGVSSSLTEAANSVGLKPEQTAMLTTLVEPSMKNLMPK